uniref:Uncharacterized protein n=1 Tax=Timema tahoe TaxID=61484 RepID=A0A7R9FFJ3_9NEOP|nr:unnamed protein product [Timema tahoe]
MDNSVLISEIVLKKERLPPVIVSFEHGKLMPPETSKLRSGVYRDKNNARKRVVAVATRSLLYTGVQAPWNSDMCRTFVGVRNKKTNKMRLLEAEYFQLSPAITLENCPIPQPKGYVIDTGDTKHAQLNKSFGSKNSKRRAEQQERTRMQLDNLKDQLNETSATVEVSKEDLSFSTLAGDDILVQYLPPFNEVASVVDRVYELNRILTEEELNSLEPKCQEILSNIDVYTHEMQVLTVSLLQTDGHSDKAINPTLSTFLVIVKVNSQLDGY